MVNIAMGSGGQGWQTETGGPNYGVQATANSLRSCLAAAIGGA